MKIWPNILTCRTATLRFVSSFAFAFLVLNYVNCFQQQQQQPQDAASASALISHQMKQQLDQQQQQPQQSLAANNNIKPQAKSNHRLVNKLKDARHRRRHNRHNRHRKQYNKQLAAAASANQVIPTSNSGAFGLDQQAAAVNQQQQQQAVSSTALTALESIVEEVARAGAQIPLSTAANILQQQQQQSAGQVQPQPPPQQQQSQQQVQQQQQKPLQQQQQTSSQSGVDILLDGSSSPVSSLSAATMNNQQPQSQQQQPQIAPQQQQSPAIQQQQPTPTQQQQQATTVVGPTPTAHHLIRGPLHSTRGFLLTSTLSKIYNLLNVTEFALEMRDGISSRASCVACNAVVGLFLSPLYSKEVFSAAIRTVCTSFKIQTARVCAGLAESFQDDFEYIRKNTKLTRDEVCGVVFGVDCARRQTYNLFWTVPIPEMPSTLNNLNGINSNGNNKPQLGGGGGNSNHNHNSNNNEDTPQPPSTISLPPSLNEHALTNMEDAPDLFEYRKSNIINAAASSPSQTTMAVVGGNGNGMTLLTPATLSSPSITKQQQDNSVTSSQQQQLGEQQQQQQQQINKSQQQTMSQLQQASSATQQQQQSAQPKKGAKMLARPQYIFDDEQLIGAANSNEQQQSNGAANEQFNRGNNNNNKQISSFVHITDIHIDPYYETGSLTDCNEPLCCRATSGLVAPNDRRRQAGRWGDYGNCDVPVRTLRNALERIREQHSDAEYWLWTGDISPHDIWNITKAQAASHVRLVTKMVRQYSNGLPVFPVIGNHEAHPVNSFSPPEIKGKFSMSWLYDLLADEWTEWLPSDALRTLRIGGFYKLQVRKGFRIIALNTNYCARLNPWSFYDPVDPANQLKWLVDELVEAELNQDKVHIIGHVPPDNRECTQAWLFNFINIVDRFKDTILAQFFGHTHRDEWRIIYSLARTEEPIGIQYIGPSITPFTENNPSYRIYHQDKQGNILDSETYYFNLTEANETPTSEPNWRFSYSARQHLNMTQGLNAAQWHQYLQRLHDDDQLFDLFYKNFYRYSDVKSGQVCKNKCRFQLLSDLRLSHPYKTKPKPFLANRKTSNHHRDHKNRSNM